MWMAFSRYCGVGGDWIKKLMLKMRILEIMLNSFSINLNFTEKYEFIRVLGFRIVMVGSAEFNRR